MINNKKLSLKQSENVRISNFSVHSTKYEVLVLSPLSNFCPKFYLNSIYHGSSTAVTYNFRENIHSINAY